MSEPWTLTIDENKRCPECGKRGASVLADGRLGRCLKCALKKITGKEE